MLNKLLPLLISITVPIRNSVLCASFNAKRLPIKISLSKIEALCFIRSSKLYSARSPMSKPEFEMFPIVYSRPVENAVNVIFSEARLISSNL